MKALTLWQPWASLIALGVKTIETRSWPAPESVIGERIAIHAAKSMPRALREIAYSDPIGGALNERGVFLGGDCASLPLGAVVATARLTECVPIIETEPQPAPQRWDQPCVTNPHDGGNLVGYWREDMVTYRSERPYGDFRTGRWAWLLDDIEKLPEPVPAKGRQKLWEWAA